MLIFVEVSKLELSDDISHIIFFSYYRYRSNPIDSYYRTSISSRKEIAVEETLRYFLTEAGNTCSTVSARKTDTSQKNKTESCQKEQNFCRASKTQILFFHKFVDFKLCLCVCEGTKFVSLSSFFRHTTKRQQNLVSLSIIFEQ